MNVRANDAARPASADLERPRTGLRTENRQLHIESVDGPRVDRSWSSVLPCVAACLIVYVAFIWRQSWVVRGHRRFTLFDDAMISMSYARTFADGQGLVWFPGAPRVEGFSNPLWTFMMAGLHGFPPASRVPLAIMVVGCVLLVGTALVSARIVVELRSESRLPPAVAALLVGTAYPLVYWTLRGMEVGMVTFLEVLACYLALLLVRTERRTRSSSPASASSWGQVCSRERISSWPQLRSCSGSQSSFAPSVGAGCSSLPRGASSR